MYTVYYGITVLLIFIAFVFLSEYFDDLRSKWKDTLTKVRKLRIRTPFSNQALPTKEKEIIDHSNTNTPVL